jgi:hypothetical protein
MRIGEMIKWAKKLIFKLIFILKFHFFIGVTTSLEPSNFYPARGIVPPCVGTNVADRQ